MKIGTKSILFGAHCFVIHPWFVAMAWWKLYGIPWHPGLWAAFFLHDLGYWGKPNMDGPEGEEHPRFGAAVMGWIFGQRWYEFTLYHSRFLAKKYNASYSRLCVADKLALSLEPGWLYLVRINLSGEIHEYMQGQGARTPAGERTQWQWQKDVRRYCCEWAYEHRNIKTDTWTGTLRDLAKAL